MQQTPTQTSGPDTSREIVSTRLLDAPRERVFQAFEGPVRLAQWWGPSGFRSTFHEFDFRAGGHWRFVMHGPDGRDYPNHSVFAEIDKPARIVFEHLSDHWFRMTITLDEQDGKTRITWSMRLESAEERDRIAPFVVPANEQNLDRLQSLLATTA